MSGNYLTLNRLKRYFIFVVIFLLVLWRVTYYLKSEGYGISYQVSPSMPEGFYLLLPAHHLKRHDVVIFYPPEKIKRFLLQHHWVPDDGLLMKYIFAVPGDRVCKKNQAIFINDKRIASVYRFYAPNKLLPNLKFCATLKNRQYLLMSTRSARSFDGRYFGPIEKKNIKSRAIKLF